MWIEAERKLCQNPILKNQDREKEACVANFSIAYYAETRLWSSLDPFYYNKINKMLKKIIQKFDLISQQLHDNICSPINMSDALKGLNTEVMCSLSYTRIVNENEVSKAEMLQEPEYCEEVMIWLGNREQFP